MARLSETLKDLSLEEHERTCFQCSEMVKEGGFWHGAVCVSLCSSCARDPKVLGAILADALFDDLQDSRGSGQTSIAARALERLEIAFWKAWANAEINRRIRSYPLQVKK